MNILVLTKRFSSGKDYVNDDFGREMRLSEELQKNGNSITIAAADYHKMERAKLKMHGMDVRVLPFSIPRLPFFIAETSLLAIKKKANAILAMGDPILGGAGYIVSLITSKPLIYDLRDNYEAYETIKKPGVRFLHKRAIARAKAITAVSSILANRIKGKNVHVLGNGVNMKLFRPIDKNYCRKIFGLPKKATIISYMGGIEQRGIGDLVEVFKELEKKNKNLKLFLMGKFSHIKGKNIITHGPIPYEKLPYPIGAMDVMVIPYRVTPFTEVMYTPYKLVDFMACNKTIVCTDVGEMKKLLPKELVCNPEDKEALKKAILKALSYRKINHRKTLEEKGLTWEKLGKKLNWIISEAV
ncbi:glycosyltransferase [Candidatus Woesearchaeota archaeon]|nr:glycosyltransferase [Candidatus Woesearchaeota archaeon]